MNKNFICNNIKISNEKSHQNRNMIGKHPSKSTINKHFCKENEIIIGKNIKKIGKPKISCCNLDSFKSLLPLMRKVKHNRQTSTLNKSFLVTIKNNHLVTNNTNNDSEGNIMYKNANDNSTKFNIISTKTKKTTLTPTKIVLSPILVSMETSKWRHPCVICNHVSCNCCRQNNMPPANHKHFHLIAHQQFKYFQQQQLQQNQLTCNIMHKNNGEQQQFEKNLQHRKVACAFQPQQCNFFSNQHPCKLLNKDRVTLKRKKSEPIYDNIDYKHLTNDEKCSFSPNQHQYSFQDLCNNYSQNVHTSKHNSNFLHKQYNDGKSFFQRPTKLYRLKDSDNDKNYISNETSNYSKNLLNTDNIYNPLSINQKSFYKLKTINKSNNRTTDIENSPKLNKVNLTEITSSSKQIAARTKRVKKQTLHSIYHHLQNYKTSPQQSFISNKKISHSSPFSTFYSTSTIPPEVIKASFLSPPLSVESPSPFKPNIFRKSRDSEFFSSPISSRSISLPSLHTPQTPSKSSSSSSSSLRSNSFSSLNNGFYEPCRNYKDVIYKNCEQKCFFSNENNFICDYNTECNREKLFSNDIKNTEIHQKPRSILFTNYNGLENCKSAIKTTLNYDYNDINECNADTSCDSTASEDIEWFKKLNEVKKKLSFSDGNCCDVDENEMKDFEYFKSSVDVEEVNKENLDPQFNITSLKNDICFKCKSNNGTSFKKIRHEKIFKPLNILDNNTLHEKIKQEFKPIKTNMNLSNNQISQPHYTTSRKQGAATKEQSLLNNNYILKCEDKFAQINQIIKTLLNLETTYSLELDEGFQKYSEPLQHLLAVNSTSLFYQVTNLLFFE